MLLKRAHQRCWYHWILALHSTPSTTPFSSVDYKPASAYLDSPLHGSTPVLRGAVNLSLLAVPCLHLLSAPQRSARICPWSYAFFHIHLTHCTYCQFIWPPAAAVRWWHSALSPYPKIITILQLPNSSFFSRPSHTWFCCNGLALNPDKSEALPSTHVLFQLPLLSMSPEPLSRFPIRSGFLALPLTVDSHLMHTSLHCQNITSVHYATSVPTSH